MNSNQSEKLTAIHDGGAQLLALTEGRIIEAQEALADGDFRLCMTRLNEARSKLSPVVDAEQYMGGMQGQTIIRASLLQEGMMMVGLGNVEDLDVTEEDHGHGEPCVNVTVKCSDHPQPQRFGGDQEVLIRVAGSAE